MSALPPEADIDRACRDVRYVPKADILRCGRTSLFDHLIGEQLRRIRDGEAERFSRLQVDDEFERGRQFDRDIGRLAIPRRSYLDVLWPAVVFVLVPEELYLQSDPGLHPL
jgi:hypothetical protein